VTDATDVGSWDRYWAQGTLHSCTNAFGGNYEGPILEHWRSWFQALGDGSRVVDIGTGNGAIAAIAMAVSRDRSAGFEVHGVDLAAIDPMGSVPGAAELLAGIQFHPSTSAADLPFDAASIDAMTGQFALEYTPVEDVIEELVRVLAPGGRAAFMVHHSSSVVLETTRADLEHSVQVLSKRGVLAAADRMLGGLDRPEGADRDRLAFNRAAAQMSEAISGTRFPDLLQSVLGHLGQILERIHALPTAELRREVRILREEVEANRVRLLDLSRAAMDGPAMQALTESMERHGLVAATPSLIRHDPQRLMGWWLDLSR
jgi:SAM-dependent methyltransferase